jgi:multidrug efflux pump subunit AcrA (membrane-fusion protein)
MSKKNKMITIAVVIVIVLIGVLKVKSTRNKDANMPIAKVYSVVVSTVTPELKENRLTLPYIAETKNDKDVKLSTKIAGRVNYILPSGSKVNRGDVVAKLDNTGISGNTKSLKAQIKAQKKVLANLVTTHKRTLELLEVKGASIEQSQKEESQIAGVEAQLESLQQKLRETRNTDSYATIKSPVDGIVSKTMVNEGDVAMPGHPVASLSAENGFYLMVRVPNNLEISGVVIDTTKYDAVALNSTFNGLEEYKVYVDDQKMTTGNRMNVDVIVSDGNSILLPFDAVLNREGKSYVLVVNGNKSIPTEIKVVESGEEGIVVENIDIVGKQVVVAKQDVLLKLVSGATIIVKK